MSQTLPPPESPAEPGPREHESQGPLARARALALHDAPAAEALLRALVAAAPEDIEALDLLGHLLDGQGRSLEAAEFICRAFILKPAQGQSPRMRATAYYILGRTDEAAEVYRQWAEAEPGNAHAQHHLAACSGDQVPARASDAYITASFDAHAERFDAHLSGLGYGVPRAMAALLTRWAPPEARWAILDAGCGTGLAGIELRPWARFLAGVDLSAKMLEHAASRGVYDVLEHEGIDAFLEGNTEHYDLVAFADTLIYFGDLAPTLARIAAAMERDGWLLFNTELAGPAEAGGCRLRPSGRYAHAHSYVESVLQASGFQLLAHEDIVVRQELGRPIEGKLYLARHSSR